jgi:hypothetical protein
LKDVPFGSNDSEPTVAGDETYTFLKTLERESS